MRCFPHLILASFFAVNTHANIGSLAGIGSTKSLRLEFNRGNINAMQQIGISSPVDSTDDPLVGPTKTPLSCALSLRGGSQISQKIFCSTAVTLIFEALLGHIIEFLKILKQTSDESYLDLLKGITKEKGIGGVYDGFVPWGVIQSLSKGGVFGAAHSIALGVFMALAEGGFISDGSAQVLAGGIGGGFQGYVLSPTLLLKTRVMTDPVFRTKMTAYETCTKSLAVGGRVIRHEGILGLMKGSNTFALKRLFDWSTRYYFAELLERVFFPDRSKITFFDKMVCSLFGGILSALSTLPLDVIVSQTQQAKNSGKKINPMKAIMTDYREGGLNRLKNVYTRGVEARILHVALTTVAMKTWSPVLYDFLFGED